MDKIRSTKDKRTNLTSLSEIWLYGVVVSSLLAISNLVLFLVLKSSQMLPVSAGCIISAVVFLISRVFFPRNQIYIYTILGSAAWAVIFIIHILFWSEIIVYALIGIWLFPIICFLALPASVRRIFVFIPGLVGLLSIYFLDRYPLFSRISIIDFTISRYITPVYFFILGVFFFLIFLRGFYTRLLSTRMIISMATIVFIPIVILTMVAYSNTKLNDTLAAVNALDQIAARKSDEIIRWSLELLSPFDGLLTDSDTYQMISRLLQAHATNDSRALQIYRDSLEFILANLNSRYGFEEIYIMDTYGTVVISTSEESVEEDFRYYEFFWEGKADPIIIPPRYFPLKDQVSIFASRPINNPANEIIGVISARANADKLIELVTEPATEPYKTTLSYLMTADGALITNSSGRPATTLDTIGARNVLSAQENGNASYKNIIGEPVVGVYNWIPELDIAILVEASETEIYQRLPGIITSNLSIGLLAFILAIVAAVTIVRSITRPIDTLVKASNDVISGNLNIQVTVEREDELGILTTAFNKMTSELKTLVSGLETRVADRTRDLESRSLELQTAALIARDASLAPSVNDLLKRTARLIHERFGFYHVGVFLNDDKSEFTVLYAAAGDAGQILLANNHKLKIGETGIVGSVSESGEPRIALDVGADAVYFRNPLLPYTRSEMALPLKIGKKTIGVLDVQSDKVNAYDQNDITIMSILTDQLSIAIERTRLLEESTKNTTMMEMALQSQTARGWREYINRSILMRGYRYEGVEIKPLKLPDSLISPEMVLTKPVIQMDETGKSGCLASIPILLRGVSIGTIKIRFSSGKIPQETIRFLEDATNRLSLALENARLLQDAQRMAIQEQQLNIISGQIQQSADLETILQNTVKELGKRLSVPKTFIQIGLSKNSESTNQ